MPSKNQTTKCKKTSQNGWVRGILGTEPKHDAGRAVIVFVLALTPVRGGGRTYWSRRVWLSLTRDNNAAPVSRVLYLDNTQCFCTPGHDDNFVHRDLRRRANREFGRFPEGLTFCRKPRLVRTAKMPVSDDKVYVGPINQKHTRVVIRFIFQFVRSSNGSMFGRKN